MTAWTDTQVAEVKKALGFDRRLTIVLINEESGFSVLTIHTILAEDLAIGKVCVKLVLTVLSEESKLSRKKDFLDDGTWNPDTKWQSSEWHSCPKKAYMSKSKLCRLLLSIDWRDIIHKEFVSAGMTVNAGFYVQVLRNHVKCAKMRLLCGSCLRNFAWQRCLTPSYRPDLEPSDFFLFPRIKETLIEHRFDSNRAVQAATTKTVNSIAKTDSQKGFDEFQIHNDMAYDFCRHASCFKLRSKYWCSAFRICTYTIKTFQICYLVHKMYQTTLL